MAILSGMALRLFVKNFISIYKSFYTLPLVVTACVMAYGGSIAFSGGSDAKSTADKTDYDRRYILTYTDGIKAIFETEDGRSLVTVGSTLSSAGKIVSIEKRNGRWTVSTSKKLNFVLN